MEFVRIKEKVRQEERSDIFMNNVLNNSSYYVNNIINKSIHIKR